MNLQGKRAAIVTLGCKVNQYETDAMYGMLKEAGVTMVDPKEAADIYIVNTCSVTNMAERKSRQMLHRAKEEESRRCCSSSWMLCSSWKRRIIKRYKY